EQRDLHAVLEQAAEGVAAAKLFAPGQRHARRGGQLAPGGRLLGRERVLEPERVVLLGRLGDPAGQRQRPAAAIEQDVDPVADRAADPPQWLEPALEVVAPDVPPAALAGLERPDLHGGVALGEQAPDQLLGSLERGAGVLVGTIRRPAGAAVARAAAGAGSVS